jgi:hypothetical protein
LALVDFVDRIDGRRQRHHLACAVPASAAMGFYQGDNAVRYETSRALIEGGV